MILTVNLRRYGTFVLFFQCKMSYTWHPEAAFMNCDWRQSVFSCYIKWAVLLSLWTWDLSQCRGKIIDNGILLCVCEFPGFNIESRNLLGFVCLFVFIIVFVLNVKKLCGSVREVASLFSGEILIRNTISPLHLFILFLLILMAPHSGNFVQDSLYYQYLSTSFSITLNFFMVPTSVTVYIPTFLTSIYVCYLGNMIMLILIISKHSNVCFIHIF